MNEDARNVLGVRNGLARRSFRAVFTPMARLPIADVAGLQGLMRQGRKGRARRDKVQGAAIGCKSRRGWTTAASSSIEKTHVR